MITIICYNMIEYWEKRENALKFYDEAARFCEGSERDRYLNIVWDLEDGKDICTDIVSFHKYTDKEIEKYLEMGFLQKKKIDNPNGTRDYKNKIYYPIF